MNRKSILRDTPKVHYASENCSHKKFHDHFKTDDHKKTVNLDKYYENKYVLILKYAVSNFNMH